MKLACILRLPSALALVLACVRLHLGRAGCCGALCDLR